MPDNDAVIAASDAVSSAPAADASKDVMSTSTILVDVAPKVDDKPVDPPVISPVADVNANVPKDAPKWFQERFNEMTKTNRTLERERSALIEQNAQLLAAAAAAKGGAIPSVITTELPIAPINTQQPQDIDTLVNKRVALIKFNADCDKIASEGKKEFSDFDNAIGILHQVGLIEPPDSKNQPVFLQVATTLENPHKVMHYLGSNPDEAAKLRTLDQVGLARELTKLEFKINQPKSVSVSNVPPPIRPINGVAKGETDIYDKNLPMDVWVEARRKQRTAKFNARRGNR